MKTKIPLILAIAITACAVLVSASMTITFNHVHHGSWTWLVYLWQISVVTLAWTWWFAHRGWCKAIEDRGYWFGRAEHWRKQWERDYDQEIKGYQSDEGRHHVPDEPENEGVD